MYTTEIKLSVLNVTCNSLIVFLSCHVVVMEAIIISSESEMSDSGDSEFEKEIEEAKRRSILDRKLNGNHNVGERSVDADK